MHHFSWIQLLVFFSLLLITTKLLGSHLYKVLTPAEKPALSFLFAPLERFTYKVARIDPSYHHGWKGYFVCSVMVSLVGALFFLCIVLCQGYLPLNPERLAPPPFSLAVNMAIGFATKTDWQSYKGENTLSAFSQMTALTVQNFLSPAIGLCVAAALVRGIASKKFSSLGNFWVDFVRILYYVLLPLSLLTAVFCLSQGTPQNFQEYTSVTTLEGSEQLIVQGPIASQEAVKLLGTNGGGYTNANSAHPYENPTPLSNYVQTFLMLLLPAAQIYYFGQCINDRKHAWSIFGAVSVIFIATSLGIVFMESEGNPILSLFSIDSFQGNMEGKEMRFGIFGSSFFTAASSVSSTGAISSNIDSYSPLGGMLALINIQMGETIFGGIGSGLYNVLLVVIISMYLAGLIAGRPPEYLGKKIDIFDIKMVMCAVFLFIFTILSFTASAAISQWATSILENKGPHGFTEILYTFSSATGNNGSSVLGTAADTTAYNWVTSIAMLIGRFGLMAPVLALADSLNRKKVHPANESTLIPSGVIFTLLLMSIFIILCALSYLPSLIIGPILEHLLMQEGSLF